MRCYAVCIHLIHNNKLPVEMFHAATDDQIGSIGCQVCSDKCSRKEKVGAGNLFIVCEECCRENNWIPAA
jgi:hypothetical protein